MARNVGADVSRHTQSQPPEVRSAHRLRPGQAVAAPAGIDELTLAVWRLVKGLRLPAARRTVPATA